MRKCELDLITCPIDGEELTLHTEDEGATIETGFLTCAKCGHWYGIEEGILDLFPPIIDVTEAKDFFYEIRRYDDIIKAGVEQYEGMAESYPEVRMSRVKDLLMTRDERTCLHIGPGFGQLNRIVGDDKDLVNFDISQAVLEHNVDVSASSIRGVCEKLPFTDGVFPIIVCQASFQSIVDQKRFLEETTRVLQPGGMFVFTVTYKWNYPRKPQQFHVNEGDKLAAYLKKEHGCTMSTKILNLSENKFVDSLDEGDVAIFIAEKA